MANGKSVIATCAKGWDPNALTDEDGDVDGALPANWGRVTDYDSLADLVKLTQQELQLDPKKPCLGLLEIVAHGCPSSVDDIFGPTVAKAATALMTLNWCDAADIYLSGCNTGHADPKGPEPRPVAELLAKAMAFNLTTFPHKITIYGSVGYMSGTHMAGDEETSTTYSHDGIDYESPGAKKESGNGCWNPFHNW